jgi:type IV secretion system protein VirB8
VTIETTQHAFEDELFFSLRQQRNNWAKVAIGAMLVSALSIVSLIVILPLNETKPFVVLVDKTTGEAEKIVQVRPATMEQLDAVLQAELVSYVSDRETYDKADSATRIPDVMGRSKDQAAATLQQEWSSKSPDFPPTLYGSDTRVLVSVKSISITPAATKSGTDTAQVRIVKKREDQNRVVAERSYVVTIGYDFKPNESATLQAVWKNPLGFTALTYRIDAETLQ